MKRWMESSFEFHESETKLGEEAADKKHVLHIRFQKETWTDHEPYGDTTAPRESYDILDTGYVRELDREPVTREKLNELYGEAWVTHTLRYMEACAEGDD